MSKLMEMVDPPEILYKSIIHKINQSNIRRKKINGLVLATSDIFSLVVCFLTLKNLLEEFSASGLNQYLSLVFSDTLTVVSLGSSFLLTIAESLPLMAGVLFTLSLAITVGTFINTFYYFKTNNLVLNRFFN